MGKWPPNGFRYPKVWRFAPRDSEIRKAVLSEEYWLDRATELTEQHERLKRYPSDFVCKVIKISCLAKINGGGVRQPKNIKNLFEGVKDLDHKDISDDYTWVEGLIVGLKISKEIHKEATKLYKKLMRTHFHATISK